jgi:hypothetical protein
MISPLSLPFFNGSLGKYLYDILESNNILDSVISSKQPGSPSLETRNKR